MVKPNNRVKQSVKSYSVLVEIYLKNWQTTRNQAFTWRRTEKKWVQLMAAAKQKSYKDTNWNSVGLSLTNPTMQNHPNNPRLTIYCEK